MRVKELIDKLKQFDEDYYVFQSTHDYPAEVFEVTKISGNSILLSWEE